MQPLISIITPTYNRASFLQQAIRSIQDQSYPNIEMVIVDDGSTDKTASLLQTLAREDPRIRCIRQENRGFGIAANRGLESARGEFVAYLDSDDLMAQDKLLKQWQFLATHPDVDLVHTAVSVIDRQGKELMQIHGEELDQPTFYAKMLFRNIMPNPTTIFGRREDLLMVPFSETLPYSPDYERSLRLAESYHFGYLDEPLTLWRRHGDNLSSSLARCRAEQKQILMKFGPHKLMEIADKAHLPAGEKLLLKAHLLYEIEAYEQAAALYSEDGGASAHFYLGNIFFGQKRLKEAIASYQRSLAQNATNAAAWNNLGVATGDMECFRTALQICPNYLDAQHNLEHSEKKITEKELRPTPLPYLSFPNFLLD